VVSPGRRIATAEGRVTDANGRLLAHGTHDLPDLRSLALRRFGGMSGLERRPVGDRVVPGRELRCGATPVWAVAPVVVAAGDGGRDLRQVERRAESRQSFSSAAKQRNSRVRASCR
jgi:hypothetical protein